MDKFRYQDMLPHEIVARRKHFPAAFIPIGVFEWHGEHLASGMDGLMAESLCELAAKKSGGFAFPTMWYGGPLSFGTQDSNRDATGKIRRKMRFKKRSFSEKYLGLSSEEQVQFYQQQIYHLLLQMHQLEMKAVCLVFGHVPWRNVAADAIERFRNKYDGIQVFSEAAFCYPSIKKSIGDYAAKWETSCLWHLRPDCVDMSVYLGREETPLINVLGEDPRCTATVKAGQKACTLMVDAIAKRAEQMLKGSKTKS